MWKLNSNSDTTQGIVNQLLFTSKCENTAHSANGIWWRLNAREIIVLSCKSCVLQDRALLHSC